MHSLRRLLLRAVVAALALWALTPALAATPEDYDPENPGALEEGQLYAEAAFLFDMDTAEVLLGKNSRVRMYPASTTKIMTLLLALESGIDLDQTVTIPKEADDVPAGSSALGIRSGDTMSWRDLLYGFMLESGNDGSNAIAVLTAGSIDAFVERMNQRAAQLSCEGTHFSNAHGYHDADHYTTAQDLARIALFAMRNETFRQIVAAPRCDVTVTRAGKTGTKSFENRNSLVVPESNYYYPGANGVKTGHHNKAGWCVVASAERDGVRLMAVVLNCSTEDRKWQDARKLLDYGFSRYSPVAMSDLLGQIQGEVASVTFENASASDPEGGAMTLRLGEISGGDASRMVLRDSEKSLNRALDDLRATLKVAWSRSLTAPVTVGETVGTLSFRAPDGAVVSAPLLATRDIEAQPEPTPAAAPGATRAPDSAERGDASGGDAPHPPVGLILAGLGIGLAAAVFASARVQASRRRARLRRARRGRSPAARGAGSARRPSGSAANDRAARRASGSAANDRTARRPSGPAVNDRAARRLSGSSVNRRAAPSQSGRRR